MKKVLYIQPLHQSGMVRLAEKFNVVVAPDTSRETLLREIENASAIVTRLTVIDRELIEHGRCLEAIAKHGVGVDNIDLPCANEHNIAVLTTGNANSISVAEHALLAIGALAKRIPLMDSEMRRGNWAARDSGGSMDLTGKTLGVVGLGKIGTHVASIARNGFGMRVLAFDPFADSGKVAKQGFELTDDLNMLLSESDFVTIHVPLSDATRNLIDAHRLQQMKPTAFLVNFARGGIVNEADLIAALEQRVIAGAALDAYEHEPPSAESPLMKLSNLILSPHCATFTEDSKIRMSMQVAEGIEDVLEGRKPRFTAN